MLAKTEAAEHYMAQRGGGGVSVNSVDLGCMNGDKSERKRDKTRAKVGSKVQVEDFDEDKGDEEPRGHIKEGPAEAEANQEVNRSSGHGQVYCESEEEWEWLFVWRREGRSPYAYFIVLAGWTTRPGGC
ncbi:hypothetical protein BDN72DRAFT_849583 [Pluteus cervinus]|uniref:Uncharacterized protein n=1 Tax=Pluteus cervinus TaxID=181527 RepID=A0ACD3A6R2_9AGAR|nr:hypothetical protein BDN72DRAFT_849583 [Pluteus cervinus]